MRRERLYLEDILGAADVIAEFIGVQDLQEVWLSATVRVPTLRARIAEILQTEFPE